MESPIKSQCRATITAPSSEGYSRVCMRRQLRATHRKRRRCERRACDNGYCWQHQQLAAEMERAQRIMRGQPVGDAREP